jgi:hypothetical protein
VIEHVRYGNYAGKVNEDFRQNFYISAPPETHSTKPGLHVKTGTFVESFVWVCPERRVILPTSIGEKTPNAERVAILLGTYNLLTSIDAGDDLASEEFTRTRPLGELKMNLRHLRAAGFKPVLIDYYDLVAFPTNTQKILFIKERIVEPFKESNEDWC